MAERMTSPEQATTLKRVLDACVDDLKEQGFDEGQIGAAMTGVGLALSTRHGGPEVTIRNLDAVRRALVEHGVNEVFNEEDEPWPNVKH